MRKILNITKEQAVDLYEKHKTLTNVANELGFCIEAVRHFFVKNNIEYNKQVNYKCNDYFFHNLTEKSMYWLGFFSADGNIAKDKPRVALTLGGIDIDHIKKYKKDLELEAPIIFASRKESRKQFKKDVYNQCVVRFTSKIMCDKLKEYNVIPAKSYIYTIPDVIQHHPLYNHFLRGLIDGDGWIYLKENHPNIGLCGNKETVSAVLEHLKNHLELKTNTKVKKKKASVYTLNITNAEDVIKVIEYLHKDGTVYLNRKYNIALEILKLPITRKISLDKDTLIQLYMEHKECVKISKILKCSNSTIKRRLIEYGVFIPRAPAL